MVPRWTKHLPLPKRASRSAARDPVGTWSSVRRLTAHAFVKIDWTDWLPDANFPYADFAVKHFSDNTVAPVFIQSSAKDCELVFLYRDGDGAASNTNENAGDGLTIAGVLTRADLS